MKGRTLVSMEIAIFFMAFEQYKAVCGDDTVVT